MNIALLTPFCCFNKIKQEKLPIVDKRKGVRVNEMQLRANTTLLKQTKKDTHTLTESNAKRERKNTTIFLLIETVYSIVIKT